MTGCIGGRGFNPEHYVGSEPSRKAQSIGICRSEWCAQAGMTEAEITRMDCVGSCYQGPVDRRLRLKGLLTDAQIGIILWLERRTIVISMDRGLCPPVLKCLALVDIQEGRLSSQRRCVCVDLSG